MRREFLALSGTVLGGIVIPNVVWAATGDAVQQHTAPASGIVNILA